MIKVLKLKAQMKKSSTNRQRKYQRVKSFEGSLLQQKYLVERVLGTGSFGTVHKLVDITSGAQTDTQQQMVAKVSTDVDVLYNEIKALK